jgi:hypothetical protein
MSVARVMWPLYEPLHAVTYFTPQARAAYEEAGLPGFWRGYFAGRAAPLGPVGPGPVYATFYGFAPAMVARALPEVWSRLSPAGVLAARLDGARRALGAVLAATPAGVVEEAATLLRAAAEHAEVTGRALAAANLDLPWPDDPVGALWQAATVLREHRGDGHVAALLVHGLDGPESLVWRAGLDVERSVLQPARGWSDAQWAHAARRLVERGLLADDGTATDAGRALRDRVEQVTDELAEGPWRALGDRRTDRARELLDGLTAAAAELLPYPNPIGLSRSR